MALYEVTFVTRPDLSKQDVTKLADEATETLKSLKGKVVKNEYWGLRNLAYKINKNGKGHYVMLGVDAPAAAILELERTLGINENIMRHLTVRVENMDAKKPSAMMQTDRERDQEDAA